MVTPPEEKANEQIPYLLHPLKQADVAKFVVFELLKMPRLAEDAKSGAQYVHPRNLDPLRRGGCLPANEYPN